MTQAQAMAILESGKSVLLTGAAGSGKTYVLNDFIRRARRRGKNIAVTATTGLAATHLNGATIHAWSGIGVHDELGKHFFQKISKSRRDLIQKADVLIIDEISMLHDYRLDMIDEVLRHVRESEEPFGGLQVILSGDFFQLPPVNRSDSRQGSFVTESQVWQDADMTVCYLEEQFRQSDDQVYSDILNGIRAGFLSGRQLSMLKGRISEYYDPWEVRTQLLTTNADVDAINLEFLRRIEGDTHEFVMETTGGKQYVETLKRSCLAPEVLVLKTGAHVMCIKNSPDKKYVNGSLGIITGFEKSTGYPEIELKTGRHIVLKPETWELVDGDKRRATLTQLPLRLAWAITVHKSQGMTLDSARIDLRRAFVEGMGYVALSRVRSLDQLALDGINGMALRVSPLAKQIDAELQSRSHKALKKYDTEIAEWQEAEKTRKDVPEPEPKASAWADKVATMRKTYPNAYKPWSKHDDESLRKDFLDGKTVEDMSDTYGRHVGAVSIRLKNQFGEDIELKHRSK